MVRLRGVSSQGVTRHWPPRMMPAPETGWNSVVMYKRTIITAVAGVLTLPLLAGPGGGDERSSTVT